MDVVTDEVTMSRAIVRAILISSFRGDTTSKFQVVLRRFQVVPTVVVSWQEALLKY